MKKINLFNLRSFGSLILLNLLWTSAFTQTVIGSISAQNDRPSMLGIVPVSSSKIFPYEKVTFRITGQANLNAYNEQRKRKRFLRRSKPYTVRINRPVNPNLANAIIEIGSETKKCGIGINNLELDGGLNLDAFSRSFDLLGSIDKTNYQCPTSVCTSSGGYTIEILSIDNSKRVNKFFELLKQMASFDRSFLEKVFKDERLKKNPTVTDAIREIILSKCPKVTDCDAFPDLKGIYEFLVKDIGTTNPNVTKDLATLYTNEGSYLLAIPFLKKAIEQLENNESPLVKEHSYKYRSDLAKIYNDLGWNFMLGDTRATQTNFEIAGRHFSRAAIEYINSESIDSAIVTKLRQVRILKKVNDIPTLTKIGKELQDFMRYNNRKIFFNYGDEFDREEWENNKTIENTSFFEKKRPRYFVKDTSELFIFGNVLIQCSDSLSGQDTFELNVKRLIIADNATITFKGMNGINATSAKENGGVGQIGPLVIINAGLRHVGKKVSILSEGGDGGLGFKAPDGANRPSEGCPTISLKSGLDYSKCKDGGDAGTPTHPGFGGQNGSVELTFLPLNNSETEIPCLKTRIGNMPKYDYGTPGKPSVGHQGHNVSHLNLKKGTTAKERGFKEKIQAKTGSIISTVCNLESNSNNKMVEQTADWYSKLFGVPRKYGDGTKAFDYTAEIEKASKSIEEQKSSSASTSEK